MTLLLCVNLFGVSKNSATINLVNDINYASTKVIQNESADMLVLDDIYKNVLNNYDPQRIDPDMQYSIMQLASNVENLRLINIKRKRLEVVFDYKKSQAVAAAIPSPVGVVGSLFMIPTNPVAAIAGLVSTATSSALMYKSAVDSLNLENIQQGWKLDDAERASLNKLNLNSFASATTFANKNSISKEYVMTVEMLKSFTEIIDDMNYQRKVQRLILNQEEFKYFPTYWLELAQAYYDYGSYNKVIDTVNYYDKNFNYDEIFRYNYRYAQILVLEITSITNLYKDIDLLNYTDQIVSKLDIIKKNTAKDDWLQRYFCAMIYLGLSNETNDICYNKAYELIKLNCLNLSKTQEESINTYLKPVSEPDEKELKKLTSEDRKEEEDFYSQLKEERKVELPPFNEAYMLNIKTLSQMIVDSNRQKSEIDFIKESIITPQFEDYYFNTGIDIPILSITKKNLLIKKALNILPFINQNQSKNYDIFNIQIPANWINNQSTYQIKFGGDNRYHDLYCTASFDINSYDDSIVNVVNVERDNTMDVYSYISTLELVCPKAWLVEQAPYEIDLRIITNNCPTVFVFAGNSYKSLTNYSSYLERPDNL